MGSLLPLVAQSFLNTCGLGDSWGVLQMKELRREKQPQSEITRHNARRKALATPADCLFLKYNQSTTSIQCDLSNWHVTINDDSFKISGTCSWTTSSISRDVMSSHHNACRVEDHVSRLSH